MSSDYFSNFPRRARFNSNRIRDIIHKNHFFSMPFMMKKRGGDVFGFK